MRISIVIDDNLMRDVLQVTGLKTRTESVELGFKTLIGFKKQSEGEVPLDYSLLGRQKLLIPCAPI